ncbi:MAG: rhodanese-like domain-containing protein [Actinomycetes bacterium]
MSALGVLPECTPAEATAAQREGAFLLDVREYEEWMAGHVDGAVHVPMQQLPERLAELPTDRRIVCICRSGNRSGQVTAWLLRQGYDAINMAGGMRQWHAEQLPFVNANGNPGVVL